MKNIKNIIMTVAVLLVLAIGGLLTTGKGDTDAGNNTPAVQSMSVEEPEVTGPEVTEATEPETTTEPEANEPEATEATEPETTETEPEATEAWVHYYFRNAKLLNQHYDKHGIEMGFASAEEYEEAACAVLNNPNALHKTEKEDGDEVYYVEDTNEFVVLSKDGYMRTYFLPSAGIKYYNKQ